MKKKFCFFTGILLFILLFFSCQKREVKEISIDNIELSNYEYVNVDLPRHISAGSNLPSSNETAALGRILFYDVNLSLNNSISCGTCHQQSKSFSDGHNKSIGLFDKTTKRNTISLANCGMQSVFLWDNKRSPLEEIVVKPISDHIEMGIEKIDDLVTKLQNVDYYPELFQTAFGSPEIDSQRISHAMAQFVKSLYSFNAKYDMGFESNFNNFSTSELRGKDLFFGKAACGNCHNAPYFTTKWGNSHNIGLDMDYIDKGARGGTFKVPSLRNVELTAPYMHDGRFNTLAEVVHHYNHGIKPHTNLSSYLRENFTWNGPPIQLNLTQREEDELVAFMKTLTDYQYLSEKKYSDPFN